MSVYTSDGSFTEETNLGVEILTSVFGNESNEFSAASPNQVVSVFENDNRISTPLREDFVADFEEFIPNHSPIKALTKLLASILRALMVFAKTVKCLRQLFQTFFWNSGLFLAYLSERHPQVIDCLKLFALF